MNDFSESKFNRNFEENFKEVNQDGLNPNGINVQLQSVSGYGPSNKTMRFTVDDDYDGCLVSINGFDDKYVMESEEAIQLGMWLATRDYSFRKLFNLANECAGIIYDRMMNLPSDLKDIGWDDSMLGDTVLSDIKYPDCAIPDPSKLQYDIDTYNQLVDLINFNLRDRGININYPTSAIGIATFIRGAIMLPNKYYGPGYRSRSFHTSWVNDILGSATRPERSDSNRLSELLLDSCDHVIDAWKDKDDYAGSIESEGAVDVVNIAYLLNRKLSSYDNFLLVSTILTLHNNERRDEYDMINSWIRTWVNNKEILVGDMCWGYEDPVQFIGMIKAAILTVLTKFPKWGSDKVDNFKVGEWNPMTYSWIRNSY